MAGAAERPEQEQPAQNEGEGPSLIRQLINALRNAALVAADVLNPIVAILITLPESSQLIILNMVRNYPFIEDRLEHSSAASGNFFRATAHITRETSYWVFISLREIFIEDPSLAEYDALVCEELGINQDGLIAFHTAIYDRLKRIIKNTNAPMPLLATEDLIARIMHNDLNEDVENEQGDIAYYEAKCLNRLLLNQDGLLTRLFLQLKPDEVVDDNSLTQLRNTINEVLAYYKNSLSVRLEFYGIPYERHGVPAPEAEEGAVVVAVIPIPGPERMDDDGGVDVRARARVFAAAGEGGGVVTAEARCGCGGGGGDSGGEAIAAAEAEYGCGGGGGGGSSRAADVVDNSGIFPSLPSGTRRHGDVRPEEAIISIAESDDPSGVNPFDPIENSAKKRVTKK